MEPIGSTLRRLPGRRPIVSLLVAVLAVEAAGVSGTVFTARRLDGWYGTLVRPALAPPNWVFAPVWTALFALLGVAVWLVRRRAADRVTAGRARVAIATFGVHLAFNLAWSAAFFGRQSIELGLGVIVGLWGLVVFTMLTFARVDRRAALLLLPYLAWVTFAAYLNYRFWVLN